MLLKRSERLAMTLTAAALLTLTGCEQRSLPPMSLEDVQWKTYTDRALGIRFQYPDTLRPVDEGSGEMSLRYQGRVNVRLVWTDEQGARSRGLWAKHEPVAEAWLAGLPAQRYIYNHADGPFYVLTESYVIPYRGKHLGVELRPGGLPDEGRRKLLESFEILQPTADKSAQRD